MPNWCSNLLTVNGHHDLLRQWLSAQNPDSQNPDSQNPAAPITGTEPDENAPFSFAAQVPVPQDTENVAANPEDFARQMMILRGLPDPTPNLPRDQMSWQSELWGTKWDVHPGETYVNWPAPDELTLSFSTAWSPPVAWVKSVAALWPALTFELAFIETGNNFAGHVELQGGVVTDSRDDEVTQADLEKWGYDTEEDEEENDA